MSDTYCIDYDDYLTNDNDVDENVDVFFAEYRLY